MMVTDTARVLGAPDILVNNAGVYPRVKLLEMRESDWDYVLDINLKAGCFATIAFVKALMAAGKAAGSVINISSQAIRGAVRGVHYSASKGGVVSMTRAMALELAPHNIRVNAIAPGMTDTAQPRYGNTDAELIEMARDHSARRQDAGARSDRTNRRVPRFRGCQCHYWPGPARQRRARTCREARTGYTIAQARRTATIRDGSWFEYRRRRALPVDRPGPLHHRHSWSWTVVATLVGPSRASQ